MPDTKTFDPTLLEGLEQGVVGIDGLWCPSCAAAVGRVMTSVPGVKQAQVSFAGASASLAWEPGTDLAEVARKVSALGYRLTSQDGVNDREDRILAEMRRVAIRLGVAIVFGIWTMVLSILLYINPDGLVSNEIGYALALAAGATSVPVVLWSGAPILVVGWRTALAGVPGMDSLVALGVTGAVIASVWSLSLGRADVWFDTAVMLITLLTVARLAEMETLRQSGRAIAALRSALPETARKIDENGHPVEILAQQVCTGERIRVAAGERVPLDGEIVLGKSRFDTSIVSGESAPKMHRSGDKIEAGFINLSQAIEMIVSAEMGARRIDRMGMDIASALHARPEIHRLADRLARLIVPLALFLATVTFIFGINSDLSGEEASLWALSVLIVACPCAVALAGPITHLAATQAAASAGIHFRTQAASESLGAVKRVLFDKTGTLTEGRPVIRSMKLQNNLSRERILAFAAAAEYGVAHPVASALREAGGAELDAVHSERERFDDGVKAIIDSAEVLVGSYGFMMRHGIHPKIPDDEPMDEAVTVVYMAINGEWVATFLLGDALRADTSEIISKLKKAGLKVEMASGDAPEPCLLVGSQVGLTSHEIYSACTPEYKAMLLEKKAVPTAFVGDGLNDLLAISRADVGIAATDASSAAIAIADVVIAKGGMSAVGHAIVISQKARRVLRQNLAFSVTYNGLALGLAVGGTVPPIVAAVAMALSSLMVIANASRLGTYGYRI